MVATQLPHRCSANLPPILAGQRRCWQGTLSWELVGGPNRRRRHGRQPLACGCDGCAVTIAQRPALRQWGAVRLAQVGRAKTQQRSVQWMCWGRSVMGSPAACFAATPATRRGGRHRRRLSERTPATHLFSSCPHGSAPLRVFHRSGGPGVLCAVRRPHLPLLALINFIRVEYTFASAHIYAESHA